MKINGVYDIARNMKEIHVFDEESNTSLLIDIKQLKLFLNMNGFSLVDHSSNNPDKIRQQDLDISVLKNKVKNLEHLAYNEIIDLKRELYNK